MILCTTNIIKTLDFSEKKIRRYYCIYSKHEYDLDTGQMFLETQLAF